MEDTLKSINLNKISSIVIATVLGLLLVIAYLIYSNFFSTSLLFSLLFFIGLAFLIFFIPESGIHIIILSVMLLERWFSLIPLFSSSVYKIYPLDVILFITFLAVFLKINPKDLNIAKKFTNPIFLFLAAVVVWSALSFMWNGDAAIIGSMLKNMIFYTLMFFLIVMYCRKEKEWKRVFNSVLIGGFLIIFFIFFGILLGKGIWSDYTPLSTSGTRLLAATHAFFLLLPLFLLTSLRANNKRFFNRWDPFIILIWLLGLIVSLFRNLWLGFALGILLIFLLLDIKQRRQFIITVLKILFIAIVVGFLIFWIYSLLYGEKVTGNSFFNSIKERFLTLNLSQVKDESARFRLASWQESGKIFLNHPFFGIGFGQSIKFELSGNDYQILVRELHNDWAAYLLQMGLIGFVFFVGMVFSIIKNSYQVVKKSLGETKPYLIACFAFLCTFLVLSALGTYWETNFFLVFFWLVYGLLVASENFIINKTD